MKAKIGISLAVIILGAGAAWVGAGMYAQKTFQAQVKEATDKLSANPVVAVKDLKQDSGFLSTTGQFTIVVNDPSTATSLVMAADYQASHFIQPDSLSKVTWKIKPAGEHAKDIANMFGDNARLEGVAKMGFDKKISSTIAMPTLATKEGAESFEFGPISGLISGGNNTLSADMTIGRIFFKDEDAVVDVKKLNYQVDAKDLASGMYNGQLSVDEINTKEATVAGVAVKVGSTMQNDRVDLAISPSIKSLSYEGITVTDASMDFVYKDLDAKSIKTISAILNNSTITNLTAKEKQDLQTAARDLIYQGFTIGMPKLVATSKQGAIDGNFSVELAKSTTTNPADFNLIKLVHSSGQLAVKNLDPQYKGLALMSGMLSETPDGVKAGYELANGKLSFNGQTIDIDEELAAAQEVMSHILTQNLFD